MKNNLTFRKAFFITNSFLVLLAILLMASLWLYSEITNYHNKIDTIVKNSEERQKTLLKQEVFRVIDYINFKVNLDTNSTVTELQTDILKYIENSRFSYGGYVFVNITDGTALVFDGKIVKENKNIIDLTDPNGIRIFDLELDAINKPNGDYIEYSFKKMNTNIPEPKISYINGYKNWNWIIGAGNYKLDLTKELALQEQILIKSLRLKVIKIIGLLLFVGCAIFLIANYSAKLFQQQFSLINNLFVKSLNLDYYKEKKINKRFLLQEISSFVEKIESVIKQRENAELEKKEIEEKFSKAFYNQIIPIEIINIKTGIRIDVNDSFLSFFEYKKSDFIEDNIYTNTLWLDSHLQKESIKILLAEKYIKNQQVKMATRTGIIKEVLLNATMLNIADGDLCIVSIVDITDQKRATEKAKKNEEYFRTMIEQSPIGTQIINLEGIIINANQAWANIWNIKNIESIINKLNVLNEISAKNLSLEEHFKNALRGMQIDIPEVQINNIGSPAKNIYLRIRAYPLKKADGSFNNIVILNEDITESKTAKLKLKDLNEELASQNEKYLSVNEEMSENVIKIQKINSELEMSKLKAEESDRLKTEFINNLSHEIRTPMNGILGFSNFLSDSNLSYEKRVQYVNIIQNSGNQLMKIIDDILEISKLGTKQVKASKNKVCLNNLLLDLFSIFDIKAKENKTPLYLKKGLSDKNSTIYTDELKLNKILSNLLENALKFTNKGFIEFGYQLIREPGNEVKNSGNTVIQFFINDTGIGINKEKQEVIFNRFTQEEKGYSTNFGGLGLGLSIAKENTELLGGKISVKSTKGKGATFYITIPYDPVSTDNKHITQFTHDLLTSSAKNTVLIAEDEEVNFIYLETLLSQKTDLEINIIHAKNGQEAVDICSNNSDIDLVLMDIKMPIMDGNEATSQIKKIHPNLPIVAQTAYSTIKDKEKALSAGCVKFITKPISRETLNEIIDQYIETI